ncbi:AAA family ATPase [soil metagenome]
MADRELEREQVYVAGLYARLDALQDEAKRQLDAIRLQDVGGNHQGRSERDSFARVYEDRIAQLREVNDRLVFGRLEFAPVEPSSEGDDPIHRYIGRIGLRDQNLQPILLDWRVPHASAFYQATAANPLGARARRHLVSTGRKVIRVEDEIFDPALLDSDTAELQGEGALIAALSAQRTGRMADIVATIQAEQDRIIRSELRGVLVVQGGPGTGKTAVALHRAAYLLYSHRERLASSGVLIVGPSRSFLQYIEAVLPSLGETGVVLSSVGQLYPGVDASVEDEPAVARIKGSIEMAALITRAVRSRQRVPAQPQQLDVSGDRLSLDPQLIRTAMTRAQESGKPHNEARVIFVKAALAALSRQWLQQLSSNGNSMDESDLPMLREDLRSSEDVRVALNTAWLPLSPQKLLQDLYARPQWLAELTPDWSDERRAALRRDRDAPFTISDVPLLDEAAELLGEFDAVEAATRRELKAQRKRDIHNAERAIENMGVGGIIDAKDLAANFAEQVDRGSTAERAASDRSWVYGHVVVDEAQELSPMQWRLLLRRGPNRSFTIVGDIAQAASASASSTWAEALEPLLSGSAEGDRWRLEELSVNYRTPSQISEAAERMALAHQLPITASRAVRETEWPVEVVPDAVDAVGRILAADLGGTLAVIAPEAALAVLEQELRAAFGDAVGTGSRGLTSDIALLGTLDAKGLEFDSVVVVDPAAIVAGSERGAGALYVAMTRATQRLSVVSTSPLPKGLQSR